MLRAVTAAWLGRCLDTRTALLSTEKRRPALPCRTRTYGKALATKSSSHMPRTVSPSAFVALTSAPAASCSQKNIEAHKCSIRQVRLHCHAKEYTRTGRQVGRHTRIQADRNTAAAMRCTRQPPTAASHQQRDDVQMLAQCGIHQRRQPAVGLRDVYVSTRCDQHTRDVHVSAVTCDVQRRFTGIVLSISGRRTTCGQSVTNPEQP